MFNKMIEDIYEELNYLSTFGMTIPESSLLKLKDMLDELKTEHNALSKANDIHLSKLLQKTERIAQLEKIVKELQFEMPNNLHDIIRDYREFNNEIENLKKENDRLREYNQALIFKITMLEKGKYIVDFLRQKSNNEDDRDSIQDQIKGLCNMINDIWELRQNISHLKSENEFLRSQVDIYRDSAEGANGRADRFYDELKNR